ncbi:MAG: translation initiation factor IF-2 subunit beta [Nanoarchaeota archaeon]|jgi:translation initiation factor 2 subunit 2|nr:translation initiation factor IF-2 subunit beta [Nanoarchaeota archaeon]|tara:strand:- start:54625 stop:55026 length:402 start_codon:yes stop_codon:yes gene_type:complete
MDYEKMLEEGIKHIPESVLKKERFEMPTVKGHIEGNKTIITNFQQVADALRRESDHLLKFLLKELATPGTLKGSRLVFGRKISSKQINEKIEKYAKIYVLCKDCNKPDTQLMKEDGILLIKCTACGAKHPVRA